MLVVDPMLATGGSAARAITAGEGCGGDRPAPWCLVGCPEGVATVHDEHPEVPIFLVALDERLDDNADLPASVTPATGSTARSELCPSS